MLAEGQVVGGAVGRWWGGSCELLQLWVEPSHRRQGLGAKLLRRFEGRASAHGCTAIYLETFSFQRPQLYVAHGYKTEWARTGFPHGIVKYHMLKELRGHEPAA
jgi:GNAT superfamily N-acetyltransferase